MNVDRKVSVLLLAFVFLIACEDETQITNVTTSSSALDSSYLLPRPLTQVAMHQNDDERLFAFTILDDGKAYYRYQDENDSGSSIETWTGSWKNFGSTELKPTLAVGTQSDDRMYVFSIRESDRRLVYRRQYWAGYRSFTDWKIPSKYNYFGLNGKLAVSNYAGGSIAVFGQRDNGYLYVMRRSSSGSWRTRVKLGNMPIDKNFTVAKQDNGRLVVFMSKNGALYRISQTGSYSWESSYTQINSAVDIDPNADITATLNKDGKVQVFVNANNGDVFTTRQDPYGPDGWHGWLWLIQNQTIDNPIGMSYATGAYRRMVATKDKETGRLMLVYAMQLHEQKHKIGYIAQQPNGLWGEAGLLKNSQFTVYSFIYPQYIDDASIAVGHYDDNRLGVFTPMNYFEQGGDDLYVYTTLQETPQDLTDWEPWYQLGEPEV